MKTRYTVVGGEIIAQKSSGVRAEYVPDALGSTVTLAQNAPPASYTPLSYYPYGTVANEGPDSPVTPLKFAGTHGYYSDASGLIYVQGRYLSTNQGRFIGAAGSDRRTSWNHYAYTNAVNRAFAGVAVQKPTPPAVPPKLPVLPSIPPWPCGGKIKNPFFPNPPIPNPPVKTVLLPGQPATGPGSPLGRKKWDNCYVYACDRVLGGDQPNGGSGDNTDCDTLISNAIADGAIRFGCVDGTCPPGYHEVRAYTTPSLTGPDPKSPSYGKPDFHWSRCDNGVWTEKHGFSNPVTIITGDVDAQEKASWNYGRCKGNAVLCSPSLIDAVLE